MERCKCCGAIINSNDTKRLEDIPEQEHIKRAIEVCLVGNHTIGIIDTNGYGKEFGKWLSSHDISVWVEKPCKCGNFMDSQSECHCTISQIRQWRLRKSFLHCMNADVVIESTRPRVRTLIKPYQGEPESEMLKRVETAKQIEIKDSTLDEQSNTLLIMAIDRLGLIHTKIESVKRVAVSIAKLDGLDVIKVQHISEAVQYAVTPINI